MNMEEYLTNSDRFFSYKGKIYDLEDLKDGELKLKSVATGEYLFAQWNDEDVFAYFKGYMWSLKEIASKYKQ